MIPIHLWLYASHDYAGVREKLEEELAIKLRKASEFASENKFTLRRVGDCNIIKNHLEDFIDLHCSITYYSPEMLPLYHEGRLTGLDLHYVRLETTISARAFYIQYGRSIRVLAF